MCAPAALGIVGAVASLAGSAVAAKGQQQQAEAQANQLEYNAVVEKINARTRRQEGFVAQEDIGLKAARRMGEQVAAAGASGVDPYYGSAASVIFEEGAFAESVDKGKAYIEAESKATAHINKARDLEAQAKAVRQSGKTAATGTFLSGLGGAIGGLKGAFTGGGTGVPATTGGGFGW